MMYLQFPITCTEIILLFMASRPLTLSRTASAGRPARPSAIRTVQSGRSTAIGQTGSLDSGLAASPVVACRRLQLPIHQRDDR